MRLLLFSWVRLRVVGESDVESAATEHDECYEVGDVVEAVGHADGDLDAVVGRLEPGVGVAQLDGPEDVGPRRRIFRDGLPLSYNCTICRLNASS